MIRKLNVACILDKTVGPRISVVLPWSRTPGGGGGGRGTLKVSHTAAGERIHILALNKKYINFLIFQICCAVLRIFLLFTELAGNVNI